MVYFSFSKMVSWKVSPWELQNTHTHAITGHLLFCLQKTEIRVLLLLEALVEALFYTAACSHKTWRSWICLRHLTPLRNIPETSQWTGEKKEKETKYLLPISYKAYNYLAVSLLATVVYHAQNRYSYSFHPPPAITQYILILCTHLSHNLHYFYVKGEKEKQGERYNCKNRN